MGNGTMFSLANQEPLRNPDKGPLGVVLSTGEFQITVTDMEIPGRGFPFRLARTYRSKSDGQVSLLGYNWSLSLDEYLTPGFWSDSGATCPAVLWQMGNGFSDVWVNECHPDHNQQWRAGLGFFGMIRPYGTNQRYQIRYPDGTVKTYAQRGLNAQDQEIWILTKIEDRNGNFMTIHHDVTNTDRGIDWITDTLGRKITFGYDASDRLTSVTDFNTPSRSVVYAYDGNGDLVTVRSPIVTQKSEIDQAFAGKTTTYQYLGTSGCDDALLKHNIKTITDGNLNVVLTNNYLAVVDTDCGTVGQPVDVVVSQDYGGGAVDPKLTYQYVLVSSGQTAPNTLASKTTVTDRNGNRQVHAFNGQGNPIWIEYQTTNPEVRPGEINYTEHFTYVDYGSGYQPMLVAQHTQSGGTNVNGTTGNLDPYSAGMTETMLYDQFGGPFAGGNVLSVHRAPRGTPGQFELITSYTYEPVFNQPLTITDPSGHVTTFTYDYQEGTYADLTAGSPPPAPVDPTWWSTSHIWNFMQPQPEHGVKGDINGDGPHRGGNLIKVDEGVARDFAGMPTTPGPEDQIASYTAYNNFGLPIRAWDAECNETQFRYFPEDNPDGEDPATPDPPLEDGRDLSSAPDEAGGGYLKEKVLDATLTSPLPVGVSSSLREGGQDPDEQDVHLWFEYDPVGNITKSTDGRGVSTEYTVNELNQIVQIIHAASASTDSPTAPPFSYREQFQFDGNNNLIKHRTEQRDDVPQAEGQNKWVTESTCYDSNNRKWRETVSTADSPSVSATTLYYYDRVGNLTKTVSPAGNVVNRTYDKRDLLFQEIALNGCIEDPPASADCSVPPPTLQCTSPVGSTDAVTTYDYDGSGNVIRVTDPEGHMSLTGYDGYGRKVVEFDPAYQKRSLTYDVMGNVTDQVFRGTVKDVTPTPPSPPAPSYPEIAHQRMYYDELGRLRRSDVRFMKWDAAGNPISITTDGSAGLSTAADSPLPLGDGYVTSLIGYDRLGRAVKLVNDHGYTTEIRYDGLGRKLKTFLNEVAPFTVTPGGADERNSTETVYDANGNPRCVVETQWGAEGARELDAQRFRKDFKYDSMNRLTDSRVVGKAPADSCPTNFDSPSSPGENLITQYKYDSRGNRIRVKDAAGNLAKSFYDGLNRLYRTETNYLYGGTLPWEGRIPETIEDNHYKTAGNPDGVVTTIYNYDARGLLASFQDDNNRATSFLYDKLNRKTRVTYPDTSYREVTYNRDSKAVTLLYSKSPSSLTVSLEYDWLHRLKQLYVGNAYAPGVMGTKGQTFQYDGMGRLTLAQDDWDVVAPDTNIDSEVVMTYNSLGKVLTEQQKWADNSSGTYVTGYETVSSDYDSLGFRTKVYYPGPGQVSDPVSVPDRTPEFTADELGRIKTIHDGSIPVGGGNFQYDYLGANRVLKRTSPNGTMLTMLTVSGDTVAGGYDNLGRAKDLSNTTAVGTPGFAEFGYGYDTISNRKFQKRINEVSSPNGETYGYDSTSRLVNRKEGNVDINGTIVSTSLTQDFFLDGLGNWKSHKRDSSTYNQTINSLNQYTIFNGPGGQRTLYYDFLGNLMNESFSAGEQQYVYDFLNRLVGYLSVGGDYTTYRYDALGRRISKNLNGWTHTRYIYDGNRLIQERNTSGASILANYVYGVSPDEILTRRSGGTNIYYHSDVLGSVAAVTNDTGTVLERYKYDAYGQVTFMNATGTPQGCMCSPLQNNILYTGRYFDIESRLYYYRARMYHPYLGRFLQRDPLGERAGLNLYNYVFNNPVRFTDPSGMMSAEQRQNLVAPQTRGSRNPSCMAGLCGGGGQYSLGAGGEGSMDVMVSWETGSADYSSDPSGGTSPFSESGGSVLNSPSADAPKQWPGYVERAAVQESDMDPVRTMATWISLSIEWGLRTTSAGLDLAANKISEPVGGWLNKHCLMCPYTPSRFSPPIALGIVMPPFGRIAVGSLTKTATASALGDLTAAEASSIQAVVNQAGRPLEVVGSAARGARTAVSDIDYVVPPSSLKYFEGLETQLPGIDPSHGIIPGFGNPNIGPVIRFEPTVFP